jgi:hypothetical protein
MGLQQSKDELLYQQVSYGTVEGIKALRREGAGLEVIPQTKRKSMIFSVFNYRLRGYIDGNFGKNV